MSCKGRSKGKGERMICPNCHARIEDGSSFCPYCGYPVKGAEENIKASPSAPSLANPDGADHGTFPASPQPPMQPAADQNSFSGGPTAPMPAPAPIRRKLSVTEIWLIVIGICALAALIISIVNAVHIETVKNALIEVIQNLQNASN